MEHIKFVLNLLALVAGASFGGMVVNTIWISKLKKRIDKSFPHSESDVNYSNAILVQMCDEVIEDMQDCIKAIKDCGYEERLCDESIDNIKKCYDIITSNKS